MRIYVEKVGRRIYLTGSSPSMASKCKRIAGATAKWNKKAVPNEFLGWTYPLDYTTCMNFRREFGDDLVIGPELTAWAREEKKKRAVLDTILSSDAFDLPKVEVAAPRLAKAMANRTYQQVGSAFLRQAARAIVADEPGLGKTLQYMGAVVEAGLTGPLLVMAPSAAIQITWPNELRLWLPDDAVYVAVGSRKQREAVIQEFLDGVTGDPDKRHWLLCNFEMARAVRQPNKVCAEPGPFKWTHKDKKTGITLKGVWHHPYAALFNIQWSGIMADESQRALITRTSEKHDQSQTRAGAGMLRIRDDGLRTAASGTPFRGKVENLWGTLNWIRPDIYTSYWNWIKKWFVTYEDSYSLIIGELNPNTEKEFYKELDSVMIRRKKSEVAPELPPKQYAGRPLNLEDPDSLHGIWLPMSPKQDKSYKDMVKHAATNLDSGTLMANGVLAEMTRLKQFASCFGDLEEYVAKVKHINESTGQTYSMEEDRQRFVPRLPSNKFDWLVEWLTERGIAPDESGANYGDNKVVIASQFTQILNMFRDELIKMGVESHILTGETPTSARKAAVAEFQGDGGPRIFFLNTDAGGVSLTLDKADDVIFLDEKWIPDDQEQVEDRIHRVSRMHQVTIWYLRSLGTIDEHIGAQNIDRDTVQKTLLDGRRGVDFARQLLKEAG